MLEYNILKMATVGDQNMKNATLDIISLHLCTCTCWLFLICNLQCMAMGHLKFI